MLTDQCNRQAHQPLREATPEVIAVAAEAVAARAGEKQMASAQVGVTEETPNPSIERTSNGMPRLAFISFWAKPVMPLLAAHVKR